MDDLCELFEYVDVNQISDKNKNIINKDFHIILKHYLYFNDNKFVLDYSNGFFITKDMKSILNYLDKKGYSDFIKVCQFYVNKYKFVMAEKDILSLYNYYVEIISEGFSHF